MTESLPQELSCGVIALDAKRRVLLIKPSNRDMWAIPKGHVNDGEEPEIAALRETFEETRVRVRLISELEDFYVRTRSYVKRVRVWLADVTDASDLAADGFENSDARFFELAQLPDIIPSQAAWFHRVIGSIISRT